MDLAAALADDLDAAFPRFVERFGRDVYTLAVRLNGRPDAEDAAQDAFVRAYTALRGYEPKRIVDLDLRPWVITIALNVARNRLRTAARRPTAPLPEDAPSPSTTDDPDRRLALAAALDRLPVPARQAVVLRHVLGCSTEETAAILNRPTGTVKAQVARGLASLRTSPGGLPMNDTLASALAALHEEPPATLLDRVTTELGLVDVYVTVDSPAGPLRVAFNTKSGISFLDAAAAPDEDDDEDRFRRAFAARYPGRTLRPATSPAPSAIANAVSGRITTLSYDLSACSPFQRAVLAKTAEIPRGEVRSYGWIAREIGHDGATRAVGTALGRNPVPVLIPCHRVVRTDGKIGNYALGSTMKTKLLQLEGVNLAELERLAQSGHRYVGSATTSIFCVPTCHQAKRIQPQNRVLFRTDREATTKGFRPCRTCRPAPAALSTS